MTAAAAQRAMPALPRRLSGEDLLMRAGIVVLAMLLLLFIALPLATLLLKSFQDSTGRLIGLANYQRYFMTPALVASLWNSLAVAVLSTAIVVPLAFLYAYGLTRTCVPAKRLFVALALLPLFAPSLLPAISLIYIFGNQGFLKSWLNGASIYGPFGIVLAQVFYCFPHALMILLTAFSLADG
ncbi:MAG TPA: putative 2-aminoethylphosphonate ABC transporter permease subunit, partial [Hyphomicrobiaceae bacterium]|nr:putative 2-aminoethylphosphonate ABC transporter permease subunit [Hyphomicrobiaceae bacterium]